MHRDFVVAPFELIIVLICQVCNFFNYPLRNQHLCHVVRYVEGKQKGTPLIRLCETRWAQRHVAFSHFYASYE